MTKKPGIKVEIYGSEYRIKGDADGEYIKRVAAFVDERMRQVSQLTTDSAVSKIAILAAINIADELFKERAQREHAALELSEKLRMIEDDGGGK
ncbi:MAG: cell division protein ZapA [Candidatus Edwardsbacteria bacterium]|nr:cell division protein ZapA [Candidatus Edwardsbacteria bacterium]